MSIVRALGPALPTSPVSTDPAVRVLVVDDDATTRRAFSLRLRAQGYDVELAAGGPDALERLAAETFDVVLLDLRMPGLGGLDVLRLVRERYAPQQLPVIMVTVSEDRADILQALEMGANDYVIKPGDMPVLLARIGTQVALKRAIDGIEQSRHELERRVLERTVELLEANERLGREIETRHGVERELRASERRYRSLYDDNPSMFFTLDAARIVRSVNRFGAHHLGHMRDELIGRPFAELYHADDQVAVGEHLDALFTQPHRLHRWEARKLRRSGAAFWVRETARVVEDGEGTPSVLVVSEDISETQHLWERLSYQESHDALTGLLNRVSFEGRLNHVLLDARAEQSEHAVCYIDLDQFKIINDTCGHAAGDQLLRQIAQLLRHTCGNFDTLARLGGDEFALLMEYCSIEQALALATGVRDAIENHGFVWAGRAYRLSASLGLVPISAQSGEVAAVLGMADAACYAAKDAGRNRIHVYHERDQESRRNHGEMHWVVAINEALAEDRFELHAQCIRQTAPAATAQGTHVEILLRLRERQGTLIAPGAFLPASERYDLAPRIDRWVIAHLLHWLRDHPRALARLGLCAVNVSGKSLCDEGFLDFVRRQLDETQVPATRLCFEITETAAIGSLERARRFLDDLRARGCRLALDDFGSGLCSFGYLKNLPVDYLKIDGAFVRDMVRNPIDLAMVRSINDIGHVMGKETVAECVEDEVTCEALRMLGVDYVQGYWVGAPLPLDELLGDIPSS